MRLSLVALVFYTPLTHCPPCREIASPVARYCKEKFHSKGKNFVISSIKNLLHYVVHWLIGDILCILQPSIGFFDVQILDYSLRFCRVLITS